MPEVGGCFGCWLLFREVLRMGVLVWPAVIGVTLELRGDMSVTNLHIVFYVVTVVRVSIVLNRMFL